MHLGRHIMTQKIIETKLDISHIELIKIFFEANNLSSVSVYEKEILVREYPHRVIFISYPLDSEDSTKISFMSLIHAGFINMLDDYLLKCGVSVYNLSPDSFKHQERNEKEAEINQKFMATITKE